MNDIEKTLKNMKHCASPSLAKWYKEKECMKIKMQENKESCACKEVCRNRKIAKVKTTKQAHPDS